MKLNLYLALFLTLIFHFTGSLRLSAQDEFETFTDTVKSSQTADEFETFDEAGSQDEFSEFSQEEGETKNDHSSGNSGMSKKEQSKLWWVLGALGMTLITGFLVRRAKTRNLRGLILILSLVVLGFYMGGCPCPIMSLHHAIFAIAGFGFHWSGMIWFLGLILVTYLVGKVWCGWVCHLGALQEFLYLPGKIKVLQSEKAQKIMRWIRIGFLVALIVQILITKSNLFKTIDPFKVAFNLHSSNMAGWILLGLLLVSSYFMYRPFCKTVCPIGLILGWVAKIPGASILAPASGCSGCNVCDTSCDINAITRENKISKIDNQECIGCGNCVGDCRKGNMHFVRNSKNNDSKSVCTHD
jgi:polyferredoxin